MPALVYHAEAYEGTDGFREPKWACEHDHRSVEDALNCGHAWLDRQPPVESSA
jgi:hypothetical protein